MGEVVNLRRARKRKMRTARAAEAAENRVRHGTPKVLRRLTKARSEKAARDLDAGRLSPDKALKD